MCFVSLNFRTREEEILKFIYSTLDPGEIIYISIPYKAAHKLHGHGYVIVKNEAACEVYFFILKYY